MPNARDAALEVKHRILLLGPTGSGKSAQILTLPGTKYVYAFDSNTLPTIRGYDVEYDEYLPSTVSSSVQSLTKGKGDPRKTTSSDVYQQFDDDFHARMESGFHDGHDWICFDSATTLLDLIMDRVLSINGRFGQWPNQDDYGPQMNAFTNLCRTVVGLGKNILFTGHLEMKQDKNSRVMSNGPMMTGKLTSKIPLLFSDIFYCSADMDEKGSTVWQIQTKPDKVNSTIRTSIKGLQPFENVTIDFKQPVEGQGLGDILLAEASGKLG